MSKLSLLAAAGVGYVLGARAGRQRYEQIAATARKVADNPKVQRVAHRAQDAAAQQAAAAAEAAKDKVSSAASSAADKVARPRRHPDRDAGHPVALVLGWPPDRAPAPGDRAAVRLAGPARHRLAR